MGVGGRLEVELCGGVLLRDLLSDGLGSLGEKLIQVDLLLHQFSHQLYLIFDRNQICLDFFILFENASCIIYHVLNQLINNNFEIFIIQTLLLPIDGHPQIDDFHSESDVVVVKATLEILD